MGGRCGPAYSRMGGEKWLDSHIALSTVMLTSEFGTILSTKDADENDGPISFTSERR